MTDPKMCGRREALEMVADSLEKSAQDQSMRDRVTGNETICNKAAFMRNLAKDFRRAAKNIKVSP